MKKEKSHVDIYISQDIEHRKPVE